MFNEPSFYMKPAWDFVEMQAIEKAKDDFAKNNLKFHNQQIDILFEYRNSTEIFNKIYNPNYSPELMKKIIKIMNTDFLTKEDIEKYINLAIMEN